MNSKKKKIIVIIVIVILLLTAGIFKFVDNIRKDRQEVKQTMKKVNSTYETFSIEVQDFNDVREELAESLKNENVYYATMSTTSKNIVAILKKYDNVVGKIKKNTKFLKDNCSRYYSDIEINNKCKNYKTSYKNIIKVFKNDVKSYNKNVNDYNNWTTKNKGYSAIEKYSIKNNK